MGVHGLHSQQSQRLHSLARVMSAHNGGMPLQGRPGIPVFLYAERRLFIYLSKIGDNEGLHVPSIALMAARRRHNDPEVTLPRRAHS